MEDGDELQARNRADQQDPAWRRLYAVRSVNIERPTERDSQNATHRFLADRQRFGNTLCRTASPTPCGGAKESDPSPKIPDRVAH